MTHDPGDRLASKHDDFIAEFTANSRRIYCYIRSLVPDRNDADDVYQATSLVMWRKIENFTAGTNFFTWGCQIAFFEIRKLRDAKKKTHLFSDEALDALNAEISRRVDDAPRRLSALSHCIDKLAPKSKWLIAQRYFHERSVQEISLELSRSIASVYRSLAQTHHWLLACIQRSLQDGVEDGSPL